MTNRNSQQLRHLCIPGCPPPTPPHLLGKTHQVIHLLTRAEKQVQLGTLIFSLLAGLVLDATQSPPHRDTNPSSMS